MSKNLPMSKCPSNNPVLRFAPLAWCKLQWFCHQGETEIGGWGVAHDPARPLDIDDILIPKQTCGWASVEFDMDDTSERWLDLDEAGLQPYQYSSVWIHTHPGSSAGPSGTDEETFAKHAGPWAVMFILAKGGATTCRLKVQSEGGLLTLAREIPVEIGWNDLRLVGNQTLDQIQYSWEEAYRACVQRHAPTPLVWQSHPPYASHRRADMGVAPVMNLEGELDEAYEEYYAAKEQEEKDLEADFRWYESNSIIY